MPVRCTAKTVAGTQCRSFAMPTTDPPRCNSHLGRAGRKTKLTAELTEELCKLLRAGNYVNVSLLVVGLSQDAFYRWLDKGNPDRRDAANAPFREFRERVEKAKVEGEAFNVTTIA